jgi:chaperone modulatory protein CbpM
MSTARPSSSSRQSPRQSPRQATQPGMVRWLSVRYPLASPPGLSLDRFSRQAGLHPEMARRFVALGLLRASRDAAGNLRFEPTQLAAVARIQRLRVGLSLNYAAIGLVVDLLDRIDQLEAALQRSGGAEGMRPSGRTRVRPSTQPRVKE